MAFGLASGSDLTVGKLGAVGKVHLDQGVLWAGNGGGEGGGEGGRKE